MLQITGGSSSLSGNIWRYDPYCLNWVGCPSKVPRMLGVIDNMIKEMCPDKHKLTWRTPISIDTTEDFLTRRVISNIYARWHYLPEALAEG